jgi:hypothetical protein
LGLVVGDVGDVGLRGGRVGDGLAGGMVAPGAGGVEICDELGREMGGEGLAAELIGEAGGEVLEEGEFDEEGVSGGPGYGLVADEAELDGEVIALGGDGGVDTVGVDGEPALLIGGQDSDGAVRRCAELEGALEAVVLEHLAAEDGGELAGGVAAEEIHLPEAVLRGDVALGEDEVVEGGGVDVWDAVGVTLDCDRRGEAVDDELAIELWQIGLHDGRDVATGEEESDGGKDGDEAGYASASESPVRPNAPMWGSVGAASRGLGSSGIIA